MTPVVADGGDHAAARHNVPPPSFMKVLVVYHSVYGHMLEMARAVEEGVNWVDGVKAILRRADEFPENVKHWEEHDAHASKAWDRQREIPVCTLEDFRQADGLLLGSGTRYGNMTAQMKRLIDSTGQLWLDGSMEGKPAGVFTSTASTHGGQESTCLSMMNPLLHLGMIIVGVPYSVEGMIHTEARGGTPYGASTIAGPRGELLPTEQDLAIARAQGTRVAEIAKKLRAAEAS
jgi:NAD(P)H dehydrogenase (quinone)